MYQFKYGDMEFSKDGSWDELIALDRYAVTVYDSYKVGDTVVAIVDESKGLKRVAKIINCGEQYADIEDRLGEKHTVRLELLQKPLETRPVQFWERWAKAAASVESDEARQYWEDEFRWLFDGYRYSLGGRIQLMLGQEYVTGQKAKLTAYNCFVARCVRSLDDPVEQFIDVIDVAYKEASIERRGGGVGLNISTINTVSGAGRKPSDFVFCLDKSHKDYEELQDRIKLGKFKNVVVVTTQEELSKVTDLKDYVSVVRDSIDNGLFDDAKEMVRRAYAGTKQIIDFSQLRHRRALVKSVNGRSSGAVSWMELFVLIASLLQQDEIDAVDFAEIFSHITNLIEQGGSRRGALMLICNIDRPFVRKFIQRKREMGYLSGANISVGVDDTFMERVKSAKLDVHGPMSTEEAEALELWNLLIKCAWESAEPGIVWLERYNKESNSWYFSEIVCTNPCGEQGLPEWGVCNLGHYVLPHFYHKGGNAHFVCDTASMFYYPRWNEIGWYDINWDDLARAVVASVRLQDNIIDYTDYFLDENREVQMKERRVGIGSMGLGTLMIRLGLRYGSDEGNQFIDVLYKFIAYFQYLASMWNAKEKGSFPAFNLTNHVKSGFMKRLLNEFPSLEDGLKVCGIRNVTSSTQAPTGSTGTYIDNIPQVVEEFGGCTTGIEPYYSYKFYRASRLGFTEQTAHIAQQYMDEHGLSDVSELPDYFVTAMDLEPSDHVKVQAAVQRWTDSSISKTANCPNDYTVEQTDELYMLSYDLGLKGMTIYRDGSREAQVLATSKEDAKLESHIEADKLLQIKQAETLVDDEHIVPIEKRPERLFGFTDKIQVRFGDKMVKAYVTINVNGDGVPVEVFVASNNTEFDANAAVIGRLVTQFLRFGNTSDNVDQIVKHLRKGQTLGTFPSRLAMLLEHVAYGKITFPGVKPSKANIFQTCPDCGEKAFDKANCICTKCGASKCN